MKVKLKKFTETSKNILPNEAQYLASIANFQDEEKKEIFNRVVENATSQGKFKASTKTLTRENIIILNLGLKKNFN